MLPAWYMYIMVRELLDDPHEDNPFLQELTKKYRKQVLGDSSLASAPDEYWEIGLIMEIGITPKQWRSMSLDDQAQIMAKQYLANMVATIDAHFRAQEENRKKNSGGSQKEDG